ncbi:MAG: hypothetical protein F4Z14_08535 [Gammaproteobacteria bacterium]|nr:hypothetical protein [Gammaproteobacteria bacterium]
MPNFSQKLKSLTLGATLSLALAFLIIHPGMFATAHAYIAPPDYQVFENPVDSIAPDLDGIDYNLSPFYTGRPIYGDLIFPTAACGGLCLFIIGLVITGIIVAWPWIMKAFNGLDNWHHRHRFWKWMNKYGYAPNLGKTHCKALYPDEDNPEYERCRAKKLKELIEEYVTQANNCDNRVWKWSGHFLYAELYYDLTHGQPEVWSCAVIETKTKRLKGGGTLILESFTHFWTWDATPWLGQ